MSLPQSTYPSQVGQAAVEDLTYGIDCTALLSGGSIATVTATLTTGGTPVTLTDQPVVSGNVIAQRIRSGVLTAGSVSQLLVTVNPAGTTNVFAAVLQIACPF